MRWEISMREQINLPGTRTLCRPCMRRCARGMSEWILYKWKFLWKGMNISNARAVNCARVMLWFSPRSARRVLGALLLLLYICNLIIFDLCALSKRQYEKKNTYTVFEVTRLRSMNCCAMWINPRCRCYIWCSEFRENCSSIYAVREYYVRRQINES